MDFSLQTNAAHTNGIPDSILIIDNILLGKDVNNLPVHGDRDGAGRIDDAFYIVLGNLPVFHGNYPMAVDASDVSTRYPSKDRIDLTPRHELGLLDGFSYGLYRPLNVDNHSLSEPP